MYLNQNQTYSLTLTTCFLIKRYANVTRGKQKKEKSAF